ncbi:MAG: DUF4115 domain-containing protein [Vicinamibacterales bacterium]
MTSSRAATSSCTREVGLDADEISRRFDATRDVPEADASAVGTDDQPAANPAVEPAARSRGAGAGLALVAVAALAVAAAFVFVRTPAPEPADEPAAANAATPSSPATPAARPTPATTTPDRPAPAASTPASPSSDAPAASSPTTSGATRPGTLRVAIVATSACWLSANADGEQIAYRVLNAGERVTMDVTREAVLRIGEPGNLRVTIDDRVVQRMGPPGTPATLRITPDTYRDLLTSPTPDS